jgi:preprotein translocase SecE subunit
VGSARRERDDAAPPPIAHAAPDVELAEAQLAVGRDPELESENGSLQDAEELEFDATEEATVGRGEADGGELGGNLQPGRRGRHGAEVAVAEERHPGQAARLAAFLEGCWRELQRVQWPDRRQVMQATGVVIGFVIVAGLFLGAADYVANQIVKFVLK